MARTTEARRTALSKAAQAAQVAQNRIVPRLQVVQPVEGAVQTIDQICNAARSRIIAETLAHAQKYPNNPWSGSGLVRLERTLKEFYKSWGQDIKDTFKNSLPNVMRQFYNTAKTEIANDARQELLGEPSAARVQYFLNSAYEQVAMRTDKMLFNHIKQLRQISSEVMRETALTGETRREVSKRLLNKATNISGFQFIDKAGRKWRDKSYFDMLARTELMNAGRAAYEDAAVEAGYDVFELSYSGDSCEACTRWEGRLFSLTGKTKGLPTKEDLEADGVFHPNCTHSFSAVPDYIRETEFDENGRRLTDEEKEKRKAKVKDDNEDWLKRMLKKGKAKPAPAPKPAPIPVPKPVPVPPKPAPQPVPVPLPPPAPAPQPVPVPAPAPVPKPVPVPARVPQSTPVRPPQQTPPLSAANAKLQRECALVGCKPIKGAHTPDQDLLATNPNYSSSKNGEYTENCQRCVITYVARRHGLDVEALPTFNGDSLPYQQKYMYAFDGYNMSYLKYCRAKTYKGAQKLVESEILNAPDGSIFIVKVKWKRASYGHVFIGENRGGNVKYIDPQPCGSSDQMDCSNYWKMASGKNCWCCRVDNLDFTTMLRDICKPK